MAPRRPPLARMMLFLVDGPRRPWWIAPCLVFTGFVVLMAAPMTASGLWLAASLACWSVGGLWWITRWAQYRHFRYLHRTRHRPECPVCSYNLRGLNGSACPECGCRVHEYRRAIARALDEAPRDDF